MHIKEEYRGIRKTICSLVLDNGDVPAVRFLIQLKQNRLASHKQMVSRYKRHGDNGPTTNKKQERHIVDKGNLWEFKTRQGDRLLYFNISGNRAVLTIGFHKGEPEQQRYTEAAELRDIFLSQGGQ